jgi:WD40 repeat protein
MTPPGRPRWLCLDARANVRLWDAATGKLRREIRLAQDGPVSHLAFRPDGRRFATASSGREDGDPVVRVWDAETEEGIAALKKERPMLAVEE